MKRLILAALIALPAHAVEERTALNGVAVSDTATVTASAVVSNFTSISSQATTFRVVCTTDTRIELGVAKDATPTGYVSRSTLLPAYTPEYFEFLERSKTSLRAVSAPGSCNLTKMGKGL